MPIVRRSSPFDASRRVALPVALLSLWPAQARWLPKPGPWMKRFQQALAFPLYATAAWLLWVLSQQTDARAYGCLLYTSDAADE